MLSASQHPSAEGGGRNIRRQHSYSICGVSGSTRTVIPLEETGPFWEPDPSVPEADGQVGVAMATLESQWMPVNALGAGYKIGRSVRPK